MCGKFTTKVDWAGRIDLPADCEDTDADAPMLAFRVMNNVPVIVWHDGARRVVPMRWGFPDPADWRRPRPIHARAETIAQTPAFAAAFRDGQRGIVLARAFNEAPESGEQHTVMPAGAIGIAFLWRRFDIAQAPMPLLACVMATVPANRLLAGLPTDRMPAVLAPQDWAVWLGECEGDAKACLRTVEDVRWTMSREERARTARRRRPTTSDPAGLF